MKSLVWSGLAVVALMLAGCASPRPTSTFKSSTTRTLDKAHNVAILMTNLAPIGAKRVFDAPFNVVWRAALDAAQQGDLEVISADRTKGYISVRSGARMDTAGEHLGVSVRTLGPSGTEVEAVSRLSGPAGASLKNWEHEIVRGVAASLTREAGVGGTGAGAQVFNEINIDREGATIVPDTRERRLERLREAERRVEELRQKQRAREAELRPEQDADRREEIRAEIERLREELRIQEERLKEIEKDRR